MLTPTDIHYLVGLLTRVSHAEDVEIELGDMISDIAADIQRDIDISVTRRNDDGSISEYRGLEVKDHQRPLTVEQVEQLCLKFSDLPALTHKFIVSSSGYTQAAINKAKYHGIQLLEIKDCPDPMTGFNHVQFDEGCFQIIENCLTWEGNPKVTLLLNQEHYAEATAVMKENPQIVDAKGQKYDAASNLNDLIIKVGSDVLNSFIDSNQIQPNELKDVSTAVKFSQERLFILSNGKPLPIQSFQVTGKIKSTLISHQPEFKVLKNISEEKPIAGCAIFELRSGHLMGISVNNSNPNMNHLNIPLGDRLKKKIKGQKI